MFTFNNPWSFGELYPNEPYVVVVPPEPVPEFQWSVYDFFFPSLNGPRESPPGDGPMIVRVGSGGDGDRNNKSTGTGGSTNTGGPGVEPPDTPGGGGGGGTTPVGPPTDYFGSFFTTM
jgi:hypothetical protein